MRLFILPDNPVCGEKNMVISFSSHPGLDAMDSSLMFIQVCLQTVYSFHSGPRRAMLVYMYIYISIYLSGIARAYPCTQCHRAPVPYPDMYLYHYIPMSDDSNSQ